MSPIEPMRTAFKKTFLLLALYTAGSAVLIFGAYRALDGAATAVMEEIARLVGREVISAVSEPLLEGVLEPGREDDEAAWNVIHDLAHSSDIVRTVTLVGHDGTVLATDDPELSKTPAPRLAEPSELFAEDRRTRFVNVRRPGPRTGTYQMEIPLTHRGEPDAYLRLVLESRQLNELYNATRQRLFVAAAFGLALIGALGFLLHVQARRGERRLLDTLEEAIEGREIPDVATNADQFRRALDAAGRLGRELRDHRRRHASSERRLSRVARAMDVGVLMLDDEGRPEFASDRARQLIGGGDDTWQARLTRWTGGLGPPADGEFREVEVPVTEEGRVLRLGIHPVVDDEPGYLVMVRDAQVTQALEADLVLASQLRGLMGLYMGIAHDLKAPLNAMVLNLELLKRSLDGQDDERGAKQLRRIGILEEESRRLRRSVERLLAQTAPMRAETVRYDLARLVTEIGELLAPQARQQNVELVVDTPPERLLTRGSPDLTKQALVNLAVNGFEALPPGGGRLRIEAAVREDTAVLRVADDGPGIDPQALERIFELHFTTKENGTGLGLYVTRAMIESQGGTLRIAETGPAGTTFELSLPMERN